MGLVITDYDFDEGKYVINDNDITRHDLKEYINDYERKFIYQLLGIELGDLFIADLNQDAKIPTTPRFAKIFSPLYFKSSYCHRLMQSKGMIDVLKGLVYTEFVKEQNFKNNFNGNSQNLFESGENVPAYKNGVIIKHNQALDSYNAIQQYICDNKEEYPEFDGERKNYMSPF